MMRESAQPGRIISPLKQSIVIMAEEEQPVEVAESGEIAV